MVQALAILIGLQWAGERLAAWAQWPVPGALVGMGLLLLGLRLRGRVGVGLQQASQVLLQHLMLLFIPLVAGILPLVQDGRAQWLPLLASCVLGAVVTLLATAWVLRWMLARTDTGVVGSADPGHGT